MSRLSTWPSPSLSSAGVSPKGRAERGRWAGDAVRINVRLIRVWRQGTIVSTVRDGVAIVIVVADVADPIAIGIALIVIRHCPAVIVVVKDAIAIAVVAGVSPEGLPASRLTPRDAVAIEIFLEGIRGARAVVRRIEDTVAIQIGNGAGEEHADNKSPTTRSSIPSPLHVNSREREASIRRYALSLVSFQIDCRTRRQLC